MPISIYKPFLEKVNQDEYLNYVEAISKNREIILRELDTVLEREPDFKALTVKQKKLIKRFFSWYLNYGLINYPSKELIKKIYNISKNLYKINISDTFILIVYNRFKILLKFMNVINQIISDRIDRDLLAILRHYALNFLEIEKKLENLTNFNNLQKEGITASIVEKIKNAKEEHIKLRNKVIKAIFDEEKIDNVKDAKDCEFYKIISTIELDIPSDKLLQIEKMHKNFHDYIIYYEKNKEILSSQQKYLLLKEIENISLRMLYMINEVQIDVVEKLSLVDMLTNSYNKNVFPVILRKEIRRAERYGFRLSIVIIDIDNFKQINDNYGHLVGDEVLRELANLIKKHIRVSDYLFRFGGEEFIILLPHTDLKSALIVAEKIRKKVQEQHFTSKAIKITISCGISELKNFDNPYADLEEADRMLYISKKTGKNRCSVITEDLQ